MLKVLNIRFDYKNSQPAGIKYYFRLFGDIVSKLLTQPGYITPNALDGPTAEK